MISFDKKVLDELEARGKVYGKDFSLPAFNQFSREWLYAAVALARQEMLKKIEKIKEDEPSNSSWISAFEQIRSFLQDEAK